MDNILNNKVNFSWDIHWRCNYQCPYCWWHGRWDEISKHNYYPGIDRLIEVWTRMHGLYGPVHIDISGGEPMIYPGFLEFLSVITDYHTVTINTNLSENVKKMTRRLSKNRDRVKIHATFHPLFADIDEFIKKVKLLRDRNFFIGVAYLAWPPQIEDMLVYRERFAKEGFRVSVLTFWGTCDGKGYPDSYTQREKEIINHNLGVRSGKEFQVKPVITQGKKCNAGHTYATLHPDGKALRCGGGSWEREESPLGNIFDSDFRLLDEPQLCTSKNCPCNEWAFLLVEK